MVREAGDTMDTFDKKTINNKSNYVKKRSMSGTNTLSMGDIDGIAGMIPGG